MLTTLHPTPSFNPTEPSDCSSWPTARTLRVICTVLIEAVGARREYEQMRRRGIPHERALRQALGVCH